jgi:hypothetical protein
MKKLGLALLALLLFGLVLASCDDGPEEEVTAFTLEINELPPANTLVSVTEGITWGASLLNPDNITTPVAIGMPGANNSFKFYKPNASLDYPDLTKPFNTPGDYKLGIAIAKLTRETLRVYMYKNLLSDYKTKNSVTLEWKDFEEQP